MTQSYTFYYQFQTQPQAEYYYLTVKVYNLQGEPLAGARVVVGGLTYEPFTQIRVREGTYTIQVSASGYKTATFTITVYGNMTIPVYLAPATTEYAPEDHPEYVSYPSQPFCNPASAPQYNTTQYEVESPPSQPSEGFYGFHFINLENVTVNIVVNFQFFLSCIVCLALK